MDSEHAKTNLLSNPTPTLEAPASGPRYAILGIAALLLTISAFLAGMTVAGGFSAQPSQPGTATSDQGVFMGVTVSSEPYDLRFIDEMIMHHQGAIMSVQMMITSSTHPELRDLGSRIVKNQQQQIDQMKAWWKQWYPNAPTPAADMGSMMTMTGTMVPGMMNTTTPMPGMSDGMMNGGMMSGGMMGGMMGGAGSDRMFLQMMIPHHQLAIDMAQDALKNAQHEELKGLARAIISGQSAEITEMEGYLKTWYNQASTRDLAAPMREMMQRMMDNETH
jgi:uncharacterized protein (DUF305 family)